MIAKHAARFRLRRQAEADAPFFEEAPPRRPAAPADSPIGPAEEAESLARWNRAVAHQRRRDRVSGRETLSVGVFAAAFLGLLGLDRQQHDSATKAADAPKDPDHTHFADATPISATSILWDDWKDGGKDAAVAPAGDGLPSDGSGARWVAQGTTIIPTTFATAGREEDDPAGSGRHVPEPVSSAERPAGPSPTGPSQDGAPGWQAAVAPPVPPAAATGPGADEEVLVAMQAGAQEGDLATGRPQVQADAAARQEAPRSEGQGEVDRQIVADAQGSAPARDDRVDVAGTAPEGRHAASAAAEGSAADAHADIGGTGRSAEEARPSMKAGTTSHATPPAEESAEIAAAARAGKAGAATAERSATAQDDDADDRATAGLAIAGSQTTPGTAETDSRTADGPATTQSDWTDTAKASLQGESGKDGTPADAPGASDRGETGSWVVAEVQLPSAEGPELDLPGRTAGLGSTPTATGPDEPGLRPAVEDATGADHADRSRPNDAPSSRSSADDRGTTAPADTGEAPETSLSGGSRDGSGRDELSLGSILAGAREAEDGADTTPPSTAGLGRSPQGHDSPTATAHDPESSGDPPSATRQDGAGTLADAGHAAAEPAGTREGPGTDMATPPSAHPGGDAVAAAADGVGLARTEPGGAAATEPAGQADDAPPATVPAALAAAADGIAKGQVGDALSSVETLKPAETAAATGGVVSGLGDDPSPGRSEAAPQGDRTFASADHFPPGERNAADRQDHAAVPEGGAEAGVETARGHHPEQALAHAEIALTAGGGQEDSTAAVQADLALARIAVMDKEADNAGTLSHVPDLLPEHAAADILPLETHGPQAESWIL